jgi:hypothetical protein
LYGTVIPTPAGDVYVPENRWVMVSKSGINIFTNQELAKFAKQFKKVVLQKAGE